MYKTIIQQFVRQNNYPKLQLKGVFFDMDGVLLDSMGKHVASWIQSMQDYNIPFTAKEAYLYEGQPGSITISKAYQRTFGKKPTVEVIEKLYNLKCDYIKKMDPIGPMKHADKLLQQIKNQGLETYLVTGSGQPSIIDMLDIYFPDTFQPDHKVTALNNIKGKPAPDPYLRALSIAGIKPWEAVVIENAPLGVESAVAAGIFTIAINTGPLASSILSERGAHIVLDGGMTELNNKWEEISAHLIS
ncbi:MAG: Beta-phosphoglucomutase [Bacteroidetes bacterium ADurb.Bin174]|nr:MAG: Beta-phosphoglucomutase [Bacteroidetes bacterium ADurb.Bin174]